ncbi:MAG: sulfatase [Thermomicrobiales bacterium]
MNVLYIHSHDTGRAVQPFGAPVAMPAYQRLAEDGVLFRRAFSAAPTCSPSRAALLTGQSPHSAGMMGLAHRGFGLHDPRQHLASVLRANGFRTALFGMQHVTRDDPAGLGYDVVAAQDDRSAANVAPLAAAFLAERGDDAEGQPFFLDVGFEECHRPFLPANPGADRFVAPPAVIPDLPQTRSDMADFEASARALDRGVGIVLEALDAAGLADDTLVICTTDHGLAFPDMKCTLTDLGTGVLLILRGPGAFAGGRVVDALAAQIDLFPTLCEALAIAPPTWLQGTSLLPLLRGEAESVHDAVFGEVTYHAAYDPQRTVRTDRWRYIRRFDGRTKPVLPNVDDSPSKTVLMDAGWGERAIAPEALYDCLLDPMQRVNVIQRPDLGAVVEEMRGRLDRWMHETADPLLSGPVPFPPGGVANDPDGLSPNEVPTVRSASI